MDAVLILATIALFAVTAAAVVGFEKLRGGQ